MSSSHGFSVENMVIGFATGGLVVAMVAFGLYVRAAWLAVRGRNAVVSESDVVAIADAIVAAAAARVLRQTQAQAQAQEQACNEAEAVSAHLPTLMRHPDGGLGVGFVVA